MTILQRLELLGADWYRITIQPRSDNEDSRRRELILNSMLSGLTVVSLVALGTSLVYHLIIGKLLAHTNSLPTTVGFLVVLMTLWYLSRRGWYQIGVYALLLLVWLGATNLAIDWSIELPGAELTYALAIVIAGVLISGRAGLVVAAAAAVVVVGLGNVQASHILHSNVAWLQQPVRTGDAIGYAVIFVIIGLVSWLANREIDRSLRRARVSERALKHERDNLEDRVVERTRQLEQTQLERILELQRFAEFGRFSAGLLHDLANPLTAVSLNLEQADAGPRSKALQEVTRSLRYLERYIEAARKQLQNESELKTFSVNAELHQVLAILALKAQRAAVPITVSPHGSYRLFGDPVKFSQLAANLIVNAIEAYEGLTPERSSRGVTVEVTRQDGALVLAVQDYGAGVAGEDIPDIFNPFYSTKQASGRSTGIGLTMVRQIVDQDFKGRITVTSTPADGTRFVARLRHGHSPKAD